MFYIYCCPLNKHRRCERTQPGVKTPGTSALTKLSPERATEHVTCLMTTCLGLCRPFGASLIVALLPGACAPVCGLLHLRCLFTGQQYYFNVSSTKTKRHIIYGNSWGIHGNSLLSLTYNCHVIAHEFPLNVIYDNSWFFHGNSCSNT